MVKEVYFKFGKIWFEKDFIECEFRRLDFMFGNIFLNFYWIKVKKWLEFNVMIVVDDEKSKFV